MERWLKRTAVVTGASSGIGAAIAKELVKQGMTVVGLARRVDKMQELARSFQEFPGTFHAIQCDITKEDDIQRAFKEIQETKGGVDVLINNAGVISESLMTEAKTDLWRHQMEVNVLGLSICTREAIVNMRSRGVDDGHIIHINSVAGHYPSSIHGGAFYSATKHAVTALTEGLRRELLTQKSNIKVTSLSPGLVKTDIVKNSVCTSLTDEMVFNNNPYMDVQVLADAVVYILGTPPNVQVHELILRPMGEM